MACGKKACKGSKCSKGSCKGSKGGKKCGK